MISRTGSSSLRYNNLIIKKDGTELTTGSLSVRLVNSKDAVQILNAETHPVHHEEGQVFIVFDRTERGIHPVACCCITDDTEVRRGIIFESSNRFASETLIKRYPDKRFLEISTFYMLNKEKAHRAKGLLWRAITDYCERNAIDYVLGCFSFNGKYPAAYARQLSYLYHYCQAEPAFQVASCDGVSMDIMPVEAIDPDRAFRFLPPLLRYCLRLGARVSGRIVVNRNVDSMDVFLLLPTRIMPVSAL